MNNTKRKTNSSSIAIIVLSLLLTASLVFGLVSGAWFTDSETSGNIDITTGGVSVTVNSFTIADNVMPGGSIALPTITVGGDLAADLTVEISYRVLETAGAATAIRTDALDAITFTGADDAGVTPGTTLSIIAGDTLAISSDAAYAGSSEIYFTNAEQGKVLEVTITVTATDARA